MKKRAFVLSLLLALVFSLPVFAEGVFRSGDFAGANMEYRTATVLAQNITLRDAPSYNGKSLASVPNGAVLTVAQESGAWLQVNFTGKQGALSGWVLREYVVQNPMTVILRNSNQAVYAAPSLASPKVGSLPCYSALTVIGFFGDFYIVSLRGAAAYLPNAANVWTDWNMRQYAQNVVATLRVTKDTTLRTGPGTNWETPGKARAGTLLEAYTLDDGWYIVRYDDTLVTYVNAQDVEVVGDGEGNG